MIIVATAFMKIAVPVYGGYIHMGDGFIFTGFCLDHGFRTSGNWFLHCNLILGYALYAPATFVIKGLMGLFAGFALKDGNKPAEA